MVEICHDVFGTRKASTMEKLRSSAAVPSFDSTLIKTSYLVFGITLAATYIISDEPFSLDHNYCVGPLFQAFAFVLLTMNLASTQNSSGISQHMLCFLVLSYACRLIPSFFLVGYMPVGWGDRAIYYVSEIIATALCVYAYKEVAFGKYLPTRDTHNDTFPFVAVLGCCAVLAALTKSDANMMWLPDWLWMFSQYLECVAIVPQLLLVSRQGTVQKVISHFMMNLIFSRVVYGLFWLTVKLSYEGLPFFFQIGIGILNVSHTIFCGDFVYYFIKSINDDQMVLPFAGQN